MGGPIDLSCIEEIVEDIVYHAKGYKGATQAERRKQAFQYRLRKLRLRERREKKWQGGLLQPPCRPQDHIPDLYWGSINTEWKFQAFREDIGMRALIQEEQSMGDEPHQGAGLFVQEFLNSPDRLDTDIHRVFRPSNFQNPILQTRLSEGRQHQAWVNMRPALTLATKFLLDPRLGGFWYHLMYGTPMTDAVIRKTYLERSDLEDDLETARADFSALLESLSDRIQFFWLPENPDGPATGGLTNFNIWQMLKRFIDTSRFDHVPKLQEGYHGLVGLGSRFLYNLMSHNAPTYTDLNADIRFQFILGVTITHELAHAIYGWRGLPHVDWSNGLSEIFAFDNDVCNEIGWSWENHVWDGVILECTLDYDTIGEVRARTWESEVLQKTSMYVPVPEDWLKSLFMKKTWETINQAIKHVPRPVGHPQYFVARRWIDDEQGFRSVKYVDGLALAPGHHVLNEREGPVKDEVETWFNRVRALDMEQAVQSGRFVQKPQLGPRNEVIGMSIECAPLDEGSVHNGDPPGVEGEYKLFPPVTFRWPGMLTHWNPQRPAPDPES